MGPACAVMVELPLSSGRQQQGASATGHGLGDTALRGSPVVLLPHGFHVFGGFMSKNPKDGSACFSARPVEGLG